MELHRLKPMRDYDPQKFNKLFNDVQYLIKKLSRQISPQAVGYSEDVIESWFHDKLIFVFNKYVDDDPELIKGKAINALYNFKNRILKKGAYQATTHNHVISIGEDNELENFIADPEEESTQEVLLNLVYEFMKKNLTQEAYLVFQLESNPPEYIKERMKPKVSGRLLAEYLGLPPTSTSIKYINQLREEVKEKILEARLYFNNSYPIA